MKKFAAISALALLALTGCQVNYEKAKSGLRYKIIEGKGGAAIKPGSFIKYNVEFVFEGNDSVMQSTYGKLPGYVIVDTGARYAYSFMEVITRAKVGDSLVVSMSVDTLKARNMIPEYNNVFRRGDNLLAKIRILKSFPNDQAMMADFQQEGAELKKREDAILANYIKKNNIKAQRTANGVYVEVTNPGAGEKVDSGKLVSVFYKGYLLENKKVFDSNMDSTSPNRQPYQLVIGSMQAIPGWDEGLRLLNEGASGRLYIPSSMAYGMQGAGDVIPPFASLIFDVQVVSVQRAPQAPAAPQMPVR